jgi:hypothetical protein
MKKRIGDSIARTLVKLDSESLCKAAQRRTGLWDFGNPPIEPALSILLKSLESEAELHPLGRLLISIHLRGILETRLSLVERWKGKAARMAEAQIKKPIFIVGMPRSGSTYLHELLAENPGYRAPRVWEVMFPVGARNRDASDDQRRIRKAAFCLWWFRKLAPRADAVYPMRATTPHECVAIHSYTLLSEEFISTCRIPTYEAYLHGTDLTAAYLWQRKFLQYLQLDSPGQRWVLKSPDHVYGLEQLLAVFPDAYIIQTHRNPVEVLKSSADLTRVLRGLYGRAGDPDEIRLREARILAEGAERFVQFRDAHPELGGRIIDVRYTDLIADPMATVQRICEGVRTPMTDGIAQRVRHMASTRARYCGPRASAQPANLGLDEATGLRFERYCSRFGVRFSEADVSI